MPTMISDLWVPDVWMAATRERQNTFPSIFNSNAVMKGPTFDNIASGPGNSANIPMWRDITDQLDEIQVEDVAPSDNKITAGRQVAVMCNRVTRNSATALSAAISGGDPIGEMTAQIGERRAKQRNKVLVALLRAAFGTGTGGVLGAAAPLSPNRVTLADETGNVSTEANLFSPGAFIQMKALFGELQDDLGRGALFMHSQVLGALELADVESFKDGLESGLPFAVRTYRGVPIFLSDSLVRAGTTNGFVYDTYLLGPGTVGYGEKPQQGDSIDVASLQYDRERGKNNEIIYDRTRFVMHLLGMRWIGTPAGQSPTNAELGTTANWSLTATTANRIPIAAIVSNG